MKTSESIKQIAPKLLNAQEEIKSISKDAKNPFYNSKYVTLDNILDVVRPIYNKNGITILQDISENHGQTTIATMLLHESGEWIQQEGMTLPLEKNTPQGAGSASTYGRRYTLSAMLGLSTDEDDDGNAGENENPKNDIKKEFSGIILESGQEIPKEYWSLSLEEKKQVMPKGHKAEKIENKWIVLKVNV
jgi:hypothetical protein